MFSRVRVAAALVVTALLITPMVARAQSPATAGDAAAFIGTWALSLESPMGPLDIDLILTTEGEGVVGELGGGPLPMSKVTDISKVMDNLVLNFELDAQGMLVPATVTLTPDGDGLTVNFSIADGQFMMDGTGTKK
jgi:hypothetical protein